MKLILSIVNDEDAPCIIGKLNKNKFGVTKICSTGGFLRAGSTTLLVGVEEENMENVIEIIKQNGKSRKKYVSASILPNYSGSTVPSYPFEVLVGGATIFVFDAEKY